MRCGVSHMGGATVGSVTAYTLLTDLTKFFTFLLLNENANKLFLDNSAHL